MNINGKTLAILFVVVVSAGLIMNGTSFVLPAFAAGGCQRFFGVTLCGGGGGGSGQGGGGGGGSAPGVRLTCTGSPLTCTDAQNFRISGGGGSGQGGGGGGGTGGISNPICTGPNKSPELAHDLNCKNIH